MHTTGLGISLQAFFTVDIFYLALDGRTKTNGWKLHISASENHTFKAAMVVAGRIRDWELTTAQSPILAMLSRIFGSRSVDGGQFSPSEWRAGYVTNRL